MAGPDADAVEVRDVRVALAVPDWPDDASSVDSAPWRSGTCHWSGEGRPLIRFLTYSS